MEKIINKKNKVMVALTVFFMLLMMVVLSACTTTGREFEIFNNTLYSHLVIKGTNETDENFRLNYSATNWVSEQEKQNFVDATKEFFDDFSTMLNVHYQSLLQAKNFEESTIPSAFASVINENDNLVVVVKFPNAEIWKQVSLKNGLIANTQTKTDFLTYSIIDTVEKLGSVITVGGVDQFVGDYFFEELNEFLTQENYSNVLASLQIKNVFGYVTASKKLHSNSDSLGNMSGRYFHFWDLTNLQDARLEFSSTYPRVEVWYIMAIALALFVLSAVFFISYFKKESFQDPKFNTKLHKEDIASTQKAENVILTEENENLDLIKQEEEKTTKKEDKALKSSVATKRKTTKVEKVKAENKTETQETIKAEESVTGKQENQNEIKEDKPRRKTTKKDN